MKKKSDENQSFNENYKALNEIVNKLRDQETPDIDGLVSMVQEATKSYKSCKTRLQSVKKALDEHMENEIDNGDNTTS